MTILTPSMTVSDMSQVNSGFDSDISPFVDFDHGTFTSSSSSPDSRPKSTFSQRPSFSGSSNGSFISSQSQQQFSGPSFQYEQYRQQTGLPVGGLANTFAVNQATGMQYNESSHGFVMPIETLNVPLSNIDDFDFGTNPSMDMSDMDFDSADSPSESFPGMFLSSSSSAKGQFINPNALVSQENSPSTYTPPVQRMYPGMHSQQAAQAKALQQQKQQEMLRQQQQRQVQGQRQLPSPQKPTQQKDPHVEESISRVLQQMRQGSIASVDEDASTPTGHLSNGARLKKEEDDMDEDERLLASEEGKKLSSKERRQLRNKVSARAFRSRRKEYIGQLEGEVAVKAQEANDLRVQNRQLMEENTRLTDLTRMLLSSQAFSSFLTELSANGMPAPTTAATVSDPKPQPNRKDVNPHQVARQLQNQQVGMTMVPEPVVDFSSLEVNPSGNWNSALNVNNFQVFAVSEIPEGPAIESEILAGKSNLIMGCNEVEETTKDLPAIELLPLSKLETQPTDAVTPMINEDVYLDPVAFALFIDTPSTAKIMPLSNAVQESSISLNEKDAPHIDLILKDANSEAISLARLERMCSSLDAIGSRLSTFTSHLS